MVTQPQNVHDVHAFGVGCTQPGRSSTLPPTGLAQPLTTQQPFLGDEHAGKGEGLLVVALEPFIHHLWQDRVMGLGSGGGGWGQGNLPEDFVPWVCKLRLLCPSLLCCALQSNSDHPHLYGSGDLC